MNKIVKFLKSYFGKMNKLNEEIKHEKIFTKPSNEPDRRKAFYASIIEYRRKIADKYPPKLAVRGAESNVIPFLADCEEYMWISNPSDVL